MRRGIITLAVIIALVIPMTVHAATERTIRIYPELSFSGTTATCSVTVAADSTRDEIEASIELWEGSVCIKVWQISGIGSIEFEKLVSVSKGKTYTLASNVSINGVSQPRQIAYGICK